MATAKIKTIKPIERGTHQVVDDSLRDLRGTGRGRGLSQLTQDLLDGKTCKVEMGTVSVPDKTLKVYGFRLRQTTLDDGSKVLWAESLEA